MEPAVTLEQTDAQGRYSNFFKIGYNAFEFLLDFGQAYAGDDSTHVHTRIVITPPYAKALAELLNGSLSHYESSYGEIPAALAEEDNA